MTDLLGAIGLDGCQGQPSTLSGAGPQPIDVELLVQWALARSGRLPWYNASDIDLAFDQGLTVRPRRRPPGSWVLAEACAGVSHQARPVKIMMRPGKDAERVIAAIGALPAAAAATVISCGHGRIRPDCMLGAVARRVPEAHYPTRRGKKSHRKGLRMVWQPCAPEKILAARAVYAAWHDALTLLAELLEGALAAWQINGFAAPARPWEQPLEEIA